MRYPGEIPNRVAEITKRGDLRPNNWEYPAHLCPPKRLVQKRKVVLIHNEQRALASAVTVVLKIVSTYK